MGLALRTLDTLHQAADSEWETQSSVVACKEFSGGFFVVMPLSILTTVTERTPALQHAVLRLSRDVKSRERIRQNDHGLLKCALCNRPERGRQEC